MDRCPYCTEPLPHPTPATCPSCGSPLLGPGLASGTVLHGGQYRIERVLGQGGFGITYAAQDTVLHRPVAVKELFPDGSARQATMLVPPTSLGGQGFLEARARFLDEARTLAQFNHPGVVRVLDVFEENGTAYLVMELLDGETLGARIVRQGRLSGSEAQEIAEKVGDALKVVHAAGLLHRDLKPDNIFLPRDGRAVLIDFGSARTFTSSRTIRHTQLVTPGYAPLEQYATRAQYGPPTDLYALGATLYHAISGRQPPSAPDRVNGAALEPLPPGTPPGLRAAVESALALRVDERPQDMPSFLRLLRGTGAAQRYDVTVDRPPTRPVAPPRRPAWQPTPAAPTWQPAPPSEREVLVSVDALVTTRRAVLQGVTYDLSNYGAVSVRSEPEVITVRRGGGGGWGCLLPFVFFFVFPAFFSSSSSAFIPFLVLLIGMSLLASGGGTRRTTVHNHHVVLSGRFRDEDVYLTRDRAAAETVARALRKGMAGG